MSVLPNNNEEYGTREYWDTRYSRESDNINASFDWFKSYKDMANIIHEIIPDKTARILMLGCGNSKLSEEMWDDGYNNIVNIDYSSVVIEQMRQRHKPVRPEMEWHEMDVRSLSFNADTFDVALDKGTMDAMMTSKGDVWDLPEAVVNDCTKEVDEALRVLSRTGIFIYLTFGQPHFRRRFLTKPGTTLEIRELGDMFHYYLYILRKS